MKRDSLKFFQKLIPLVCCFIFSFFLVYFLSIQEKNSFSLIINCCLGLSSAFSLFLFFFPKTVAIYGIFSFLYSFLFCFFKEYWLLMVFCFTITTVFLWNQGFFKNKKYYKLPLTVLYFGILISIRLYLFRESFVEHLIQFLPFIIITLVLTLFVINSYTLSVGKKNKNHIDVDELELTDRQKDILILIINNKPYKEFSLGKDISESTIKKEASAIFQYFNVCNKYAFMAKFSHCTFVYKGQTYNT